MFAAGIDRSLKAVMVWIHGGGYIRGTAREYEGKYLAQKDVVIVTINYRLGILGYFDSDGDRVWENLGLWDIKLALEWVQKNIAAFGGDNGRVTVFGGSAGAMAVTQMATAPEFRGLFHRLIGESGTGTYPRLMGRDPLEIHQAVLAQTKCADAKCLTKVRGDTLD